MVSDLKRGRLPQVRVFNKDRSLDREGLAAVYDEHHQPIYRYVYRRVGEVETARDLTSEVFHRLLRAVQRGSAPDRHLKAWLYRTAHNIVVDHYRRQSHRQHLPLDEDMVNAADDPVGSAERHLSEAQVRAALRQLTPDQQQVIALKFLEGLSNQEVADVTGKPVGAVKSLQHRALAALGRQLAPDKERFLS